MGSASNKSKQELLGVTFKKGFLNTSSNLLNNNKYSGPTSFDPPIVFNFPGFAGLMVNRVSQVSKSSLTNRILSLAYARQVLWRPLELLACIQEKCLVFGQQHKQFHPWFFLDTESTFFTVHLKLFHGETLFLNLLYAVGYFSGFLPFLADSEGSSVSQVPCLITIRLPQAQMAVFLSTATLGVLFL